MIIQDKELNNRIFIDDSIFEGEETRFALDKFTNGFYSIIRDDDFYFNVKLEDGGMLLSATSFIYELDTDIIKIRGDKGLIYYKQLLENEMIHLSNNGVTLIVETCTIPEFMNNENDGVYPKFDIKISDCYYKAKIYVSECEFIDIPNFKSHNSFFDTWLFLNNFVYYFTKEEPDFFRKLCDCSDMVLTININDTVTLCEVGYELKEDGIVLIDDDGTKLVPYFTFFKLIMDKKWNVIFIETLPE